MKQQVQIIKTGLGAILTLSVWGCSGAKQESQVSYPMQIQLDQSAVVSTHNPLLKFLVPKANANLQQFKVCFKRLRLKTAEEVSMDDSSGGGNSSVDDNPSLSDLAGQSQGSDDSSSGQDDHRTFEDNVDFYLGEVDLSLGAASLGTLQIPAGKYRRIEIDLEPKCGNGSSVQIMNANGSYSSNSRIKIRFDGEFDAADESLLILEIDQIKSIVATYDGTTDLKSALESKKGVITKR